jgi:hypothetical protein
MDANDFKPQITKVIQTSELDHFMHAVQMIQVTYMIGGHGPFTDSFPAGSYTVDQARAKILARQQQVQATVQI